MDPCEDPNFFIINNRRGGKKIVFHGFVYNLIYNCYGRKYIQCVHEECNVKLRLTPNEPIPVIIQRSEHTHNHKRNSCDIPNHAIYEEMSDFFAKKIYRRYRNRDINYRAGFVPFVLVEGEIEPTENLELKEDPDGEVTETSNINTEADVQHDQKEIASCSISGNPYTFQQINENEIYSSLQSPCAPFSPSNSLKSFYSFDATIDDESNLDSISGASFDSFENFDSSGEDEREEELNNNLEANKSIQNDTIEKESIPNKTPEKECNYCAEGSFSHLLNNVGCLSLQKCWLCNIFFYSVRELKLHISKHGGIKIGICTLCKFPFKSVKLGAEHYQISHKSYQREQLPGTSGSNQKRIK